MITEFMESDEKAKLDRALEGRPEPAAHRRRAPAISPEQQQLMAAMAGGAP
jgi:hypothetical protein